MSIELGIFLTLVGFKAACKFRDWLDRNAEKAIHWGDPNKAIQDVIIAAERRTGASQAIVGEPGYDPGEVFFPGKIIFLDPEIGITEIRWPKRETYDEAYWRDWKRKHKHEDDPG